MEEESIIITYESLYEILRREKFKEEIQELPKDFIKKVVNYLNDKAGIIETQEKKRSIFSGEVDRVKKEFLNIKKMIKELFERRERKIIDSAIMTARSGGQLNFKNLLDEEKIFIESFYKNLCEYQRGFMLNLLEGVMPSQPKELKRVSDNVKTKSLLKVTSAIPMFVGPDERIYGPFEAEDIISIPQEIKEVLIKRNKVEEMFNTLG
ncbi:hypothetical protein J4403_00540 [Candidatus Woesearchaeota archaeon]|nr:hypothetical protein [Candidatus Woesearchaeota archaeon]